MKGWILFNGNIRFDVDFVHRQRERLLRSQHVDDEVRNWRKVLLVTAAWQQAEFEESHLKEAIEEIGIPSRFEGGFDRNVQNLALYHEFERLKERAPEIYVLYHEKQEVVIRSKAFYRRKNDEYVAMLRDQTRLIRETFPGTALADILAYDVQHHQSELSHFSPGEVLFHYCCKDVQDTMASIRANDARMLEVCDEIEHYFRQRSRVDEHPLYIATRSTLRERILSANSIFLFGGNLPVLLNRLQFFRLRDVFHEALHRGTNFYTVSAGSMVLAEKIIVFDDFWGEEGSDRRKEFEFFDRGLGLVSKIALFPHCMDRIQTDDPDNLSYLAHRFSSGPCVGLNQDSFLLVETMTDEETGGVRERFLSIGERDGVYVFDRSGRKVCRRKGEELQGVR